MQVVHDIVDFQPTWNSAVLTLGVFDGLHRGHQALIKRVQRRSRFRSHARILVTYHPHPDMVLGKRTSMQGQELFTHDEKVELLNQFDLDAVIFLPFNMELARMTALRYLKAILLGRLRAKHIVIGYDQRFGRGRKGDYRFLKKMSYRYDYGVEEISAVKYRGEIVSSSRIRQAIQSGDVALADRLLGHDFFVTGVVSRRDQRGRQLGFPTANLKLPDSKIRPATGVYTAVATIGGKRYRAMVNIGTNPTFELNQLKIEAHLLHFNEDIYGAPLRLYFRDRIRDEEKFEGPEDLRKQLELDRKRAAALRL